MTTTTRPFGTALVGQTEKALNAILARLLTGTGITEPQWVALTLTVTSGGTIERAELVRRISGATHVAQASATARVTELTTAGFLRADGDGGVQATDEGRARWTEVRAAIEPITQRLWGDLPTDDLATAGRVLSIVLDRANEILAD